MTHVKSISADFGRITIVYAKPDEQCQETGILGKYAEEIISDVYEIGCSRTLQPGKMTIFPREMK